MPTIPPRLPVEIALPLSLPKYLVIVVIPACVIAPCPKKRRANKIINKNIIFDGKK